MFERIGSSAMLLEARVREAECFVFEGRHAEAIALLELARLEQSGTEMTEILLERTLGYALCQARRPDEGGRTSSEASSSRVRSTPTTRPRSRSGRSRTPVASGREEAEETFARLGVVHLPHVPLP